MAIVVIVCVVALVMGSWMLVRPTARQQQQARLRQEGIRLGLVVKLLPYGAQSHQHHTVQYSLLMNSGIEQVTWGMETWCIELFNQGKEQNKEKEQKVWKSTGLNLENERQIIHWLTEDALNITRLSVLANQCTCVWDELGSVEDVSKIKRLLQRVSELRF